MPAVPRTSLPTIVRAAADLLEADGIEALTMLAVAERVGVRAPSLYKHVADRSALIRLIATDAALALAAELETILDGPGAAGSAPARDRARRMADAVRDFAHRRPQAFTLVFRPSSEWRIADADLARAAAPILVAAGALAGADRALEAARALTAMTWGFVSMELSGAFRLGGDVEAAWSFAMDGLVDALARSGVGE